MIEEENFKKYIKRYYFSEELINSEKLENGYFFKIKVKGQFFIGTPQISSVDFDTKIVTCHISFNSLKISCDMIDKEN